MSNIVTCEGCGAQYDATGYQPGVQFACTNCGTMVTVPAPGIDFADQGPESAYDPGEAVAEAANAKLKAHGVRSGKKRPGHAGGKPSPQNRRPGGAPAKRGGQPKQRAQRPDPRGGQPKQRAQRPEPRGGKMPAKKAGGRGPAPRGRMANAGGRPAARAPQRGRQQRGRDDYYDEEDDYDGFAPKKDNTMLIIGIVVGALIIVAVLAFVLMGDDPKPKTNPDDAGQAGQEEEDPWAQYRDLLDDAHVKAVVDKFDKAIETCNGIDFRSVIDWDKVAGNAQKPKDKIEEYFNVTMLSDIYQDFERERIKTFGGHEYNYYNKKVGSENNVGYGIWHFTPKTKYGKPFDWIVKLTFFAESREWKIVQMGAMDESVLGTAIVRLAVPNYEEEKWEYTKFYFNPKQKADFDDKLKIEPDYLPESAAEYEKKVIMKEEPFKDSDFNGPGPSKVVIPELIKNVSASGDYSSKLSGVKNGSLGAARDFSEADKNKDAVGELINIIIAGAKNGFKMKTEADAAGEASKALMNIFGKTKASEKKEFVVNLAKTSDDDGNAVDDGTIEEVVKIINLWIDLYKQQGWTVE